MTMTTNDPNTNTLHSWLRRAEKVTLKAQVIQFAAALYLHRWVDHEGTISASSGMSTRPPNDYPLTGSVGGAGYYVYKLPMLCRILMPQGPRTLEVPHHTYMRCFNSLPPEHQSLVHAFLQRKPEHGGRVPLLDHSAYASQLAALSTLYLLIVKAQDQGH